jgi:pimeloyl-ACP methyl ester carboxylesterase
MRETFKNIIKEPLTFYMKKIRIPTLLLWGEKDKTVPLKVAKKMQKTILNSKLEILPGLGHMFILENAEIAVGSIDNFIKDL